MNREQVQCNWGNLKSKFQERWAMLGDMDLALYQHGKRKEFANSIRTTYGKNDAEVERELRDFEISCGL